MKDFKTLLFIPGIKPKWFENVRTSQADCVIFDLEDSVPLHLKSEARSNVSKAIEVFSDSDTKIFVRINKSKDFFDIDDLREIIKKGLDGIVLPKIDSLEELTRLSDLVAEIEAEKGINHQQISFIPILETAKSMIYAYEIALSERVIGIAGLSAKDGDVARALGYKWTPEGLETLYMRSKIVMAARAAEVMPLGGLWQDVHNLEGLRKHSVFNRGLGFVGELILHPSNASIVNEIYSYSSEELEYYEGMVEAFRKAELSGESAIMYRGDHIDYAHVKTAEEILKRY
ncbi:CoA ester lyase [Sporosarcina sp. P26b]|uniref:HpcH/HpaI aldolase/citrate lyase family protein n=1 Tax=unclassified Sporosarcina TaxID=2647733 RepID=UPI000C163056|nr:MULTISPECIES: CoA ester lyase [unclassified Sporosarcina]PIC74017.1 CoA ester lyase [Sporosarcina sp. P17b]PIC94842.1 CoA ester lyase [Sporosarcina sp. P26b]